MMKNILVEDFYICDQKCFNFTKYAQIFVYHNYYEDDRLTLFQHENALIL